MRANISVMLASAPDPVCWDEPSTIPFRPALIRRVVGDRLRAVLADACREAGGSSAGAESDWVGFRRTVPASERPNYVGWAWGRAAAPTWGEDTARLAGAIRASAEMPGWFRRQLAGGGSVRHRYGQSRTTEVRNPMLHAWAGLRRVGYNPHRLLRAVDKIRHQFWSRWNIDVPRDLAVESMGWGKRSRIPLIMRELATRRLPRQSTAEWLDSQPLATLVKVARGERRAWARAFGTSPAGESAIHPGDNTYLLRGHHKRSGRYPKLRD